MLTCLVHTDDAGHAVYMLAVRDILDVVNLLAFGLSG